MPSATTEETKFALEGFLPLWAIVAIGVALLTLSWWMARIDRRHADRPRFVWWLFLLRCVAVLVLLWMLAGPTLVTTLRNMRTKSIAVLVDTSASMGLVDAVDGSGNVTRWAPNNPSHLEMQQSRALDEAAATLSATQIQLERFSRLADTSRDTAPARALFFQSQHGIASGLKRLKKIAGDLAGQSDDIKNRLGETTEVVEKMLGTIEAKAHELKRGKTLAALEREKWLPERLAELSRAVASIEDAASQLMRSAEAQFVKSPGATAGPPPKVSRLDQAEAFMSSAEQSWLKEIRTKAVVNRYEFGEKVVPLGSLASEPGPQTRETPRTLAPMTQLGAALQQVALDHAAQPIEAAILITDGGHNAGRDPRELAPSLAGTTLHIVPIGNTKMQRDVILHHTHAPKAVFQNDTVVVDALVTAYDCVKEPIQVELLDGEAVVDRQTANITSEVFDARVQLRWKAAKLGKHSLAVRAVPVSGERTEENNSSRTDIHVMEEKLRVLVADNFPRWETRYLLNLFKRDDRVGFDQLLFEPQRVASEGVRGGFPLSLQEWSKYRVVILGDVLPSQLTTQHQKLLHEYVSEAGGNLIIVAGKDAMPAAFRNQPLAGLLPVDLDNRALPTNNPFYLHLADEDSMTLATQIAEDSGASSRLWREMSQRLPIYTLSEFSKPKPTTNSLIWASTSKTAFRPGDAGTRSFLAWHYVGAGRVVFLSAPVIYQLRYRQGDTLHHRFWGQLLRWAVARDLAEGSQTIRLSTDKSRYEAGEPVEVSVRLRELEGKAVSDAVLHIAALQDAKFIHGVTLKEDASRPGSYRAVLQNLPAGPVRLEVSGDRLKALLATENYTKPIATTIDIDPSGMIELRHPLCNLPLLREIADASGGMVVPPTGLKAALEQLNLDPEVTENIRKNPLWNRWDLFCIFIACLSLEWAGRKFVGLS